MYTFLFACIPVFILLYCTANARFNWKSFIPPLAFGFLVAFAFYIGKKFMIFNRYVWTTNSVAAIMNIVFFEVIVPLLACLLVFVIFDRSTVEYKAESLAPLVMTFFTVMVPFNVLNGDDRLSVFMIYAKPLLFAGMSVLLSVFASMAVEFFRKKNVPLGAAFVLLAVAIIFVPAVVETSWYYSGSFFYVIVSAIFATVSVAVYLARGIIVAALDKKKA